MFQIVKVDSGIDAKLEFEISNIVKGAYERFNNQFDRSKYISDYLDERYGGCWRVTIGKQFTSCGTYYLSQLLRLSYQNDQIEIVRTQGDSEFEIIQRDLGMNQAVFDSILGIISNAQQTQKNLSAQVEYISECVESKHAGKWAVICGYDFNSRVPYVNNNLVCVAKKGIRYTVLMISK